MASSGFFGTMCTCGVRKIHADKILIHLKDKNKGILNVKYILATLISQ